MKLATCIFTLFVFVFSNISLFADNDYSHYLGLSYSNYNKTEKNEFMNLSFITTEESEDFLSLNFESNIAVSLKKEPKTMAHFSLIPGVSLKIWHLTFEIGTGVYFPFDDSGRTQNAGTVSKIIIPIEYGRIAVRVGGYIYTKSEYPGLGSLGVSFKLN